MFAYCGNNPTNHVDSSGMFYGRPTIMHMSDGGWGSGGNAATTTGSYTDDTTSVATAAAIWTAATVFLADAYDYSRQIKSELSSYGNCSSPHVHHIVPYGGFSNRNRTIVAQLRTAQNTMKNAKVEPKTHPHNLMVISPEYHRTLHTNDYLDMVSTAIINTDGSQEQIIKALDRLRFIIAFGDIYALGY